MENWRKFISESAKPTKTIPQAIEDAGGAIDMELLSQETGISPEALRVQMEEDEDYDIHLDGDIVGLKGLKKEGSNFFDNMRAKKKRCGDRKTGDCAEDRPTDKQWDKITAENDETLEEKKKKKKKPCKPTKGKARAKRVDGKCVSYGQKGERAGGGKRVRPGTAAADRYCARSAGIPKCKNPPCANTLSRRAWKCRGKKSVAE